MWTLPATTLEINEELVDRLFDSNALDRLALLIRVDLNSYIDQSRETLLVRAIEAEDLHLVACLLRLGADPNLEDGSNMSPIEIALRTRRHDLIELLIACGAWLDNPDCKQKTPRDILTRNYSERINKLVARQNLREASRMSARSSFTKSELDDLFEQNSVVRLVSLLSTNLNSTIDGTPDTLLAEAISRRDIHFVAGLLRLGADPNLRSGSVHALPIVAAIRNRQLNIVELLIAFGANLDYYVSAIEQNSPRDILLREDYPVYMKRLAAYPSDRDHLPPA